MKEYQIQIKLIEYLKSKKLPRFRFFHVPNQGIRSIKYQSILKKMGMRSGCPDLIFEFKGGYIVYIEIKTTRGSVSKSQKLWKSISDTLKTPHFILKGDFNYIKKEVNKLIAKYHN